MAGSWVWASYTWDVRRTVGLLALAFSLAAFSVSPSDGAEDERKDILGREKKLYSQKQEELIIRDFFQDREGGVFLDVGSAWPVRNSTTYYLEKHLGWSGIAIDALATYAPLYEKKRPHTRFYSYVVTDVDDSTVTFWVAGARPGRSSTDEARLPEAGGKTKVELPTVTLDTLLQRAGVEKIDFLSMDIEGGAPKALAGFDIEKYAPELVCIERDEGAAGAGSRGLIAWFEEHGYRRLRRYDVYDRVNMYFTPRG